MGRRKNGSGKSGHFGWVQELPTHTTELASWSLDTNNSYTIRMNEDPCQLVSGNSNENTVEGLWKMPMEAEWRWVRRQNLGGTLQTQLNGQTPFQLSAELLSLARMGRGKQTD
jgi:hypothetical protein